MATNTEMNSIQILVVDDEPDLRTLYELTLLREGYRVAAAGSVIEAKQLLDEGQFDVLITDMRLPDGLGLELIAKVKAGQRTERCVVITAYGSAENAVECLKAGAFDYLTKPVDLKQFRAVIASAVQDAAKPLGDARPLPPAGASAGSDRAAVRRASSTRASFASAQSTADRSLARLVGESAVMRTVKDRLAKVARSMAPVLVRGESGTGKELAASALHANSHRSEGALIAVNCSAIPENLLESEFFGARKGSYTGATADRDGFFQAARGGTLFLDEIGDLPLAMQSKLLRAIQERSVRPVGATQEEPVDVRIVSATHKDLAAEVQAGRFRQDLYYRLNVIEIMIPPLRERLEDLPALCQALLERIAAEAHMPVPALTPRLLAQLALQPLKGNVRELENLLHRAVALREGDELMVEFDAGLEVSGEADDGVGDGVGVRAGVELDSHAISAQQIPLASVAIPVASGQVPLERIASADAPRPDGPQALPTDLQNHLDSQERDILVRTLQETGFNRTAAAGRLGLTLRQIRYRIARLAIDVPQGNEPSDEPA
jgi:two-component system, NtrC family, response regulator PilR